MTKSHDPNPWFCHTLTNSGPGRHGKGMRLLSSFVAVTYRRDRFGECWHMVPAGERGPRGRTLCGEPRQGTPLSEGYADMQPDPPECICQRCTEAYAGAGRGASSHV
jgi:hypothetical protein